MKITLVSISIFFSISISCFGQQDQAQQKVDRDVTNAVTERIEDFLYILEEIAEKRESNTLRNDNILEAQSYFTDNAIIEVSSWKRNGLKKPTVLEYLIGFSKLNYEKIDLILEHISTGSLKKINNQKYRLAGRYKQEFIGYGSKGSIDYADITWKEIEIAVTKSKSKYTGQYIYDIKFNYIKVLETQPRPSKNSKR